MGTSKQVLDFQLKRARQILSLFVVGVLICGTLSQSMVSFAGNAASKPKKLTEEQRIIHVLNRLGFGARPGDVERVRKLGVDNYINQQLNPEQIPDTLAENKVKDLSVMGMSTAELYEKFPQPGELLRQLQAKGVLPPDLAEARDKRVKGGANAKATDTPKGEMPAESDSQKSNQPPSQPAQNPLDNEKYREAIQQYYRENGLQQPQRIIAELQASRILRAVYSERQLQEVVVDFWTNHFNVFAGKGADRWLLPSYDRDTIRPNALGKFSTLLEATAKSPAMLFYLDNFQSVTPNPVRNPRPAQRSPGLLGDLINRDRRRQDEIRRVPFAPQPPQQKQQQQQQRRGINENYARELMELHTLGVDGGYTQKDVQEVARCFTGWTIFQPRGGAAAVNALMGSEEARRSAGTFFFNARAHDDGEKVVLGHKIPAGGGIKDGLMVLDILAHHPSTAKFIATKLTRHFVSDMPPPALIDRVAATFTKTDGDIRETLKAIFMSPEFNSPEAYRAKIKRPFELVVSAIRTLGADTNGGPGTHQWIARMGEPLYGFQTPNGYSDSAESWVNTGGLLERMNFGLALASNRVQGTKVNLSSITGVVSNEINKRKVMDDSLKSILGGDVSTATRDALFKQLDQEVAVSLPGPRNSDQRETRRQEQTGPPPAAQMEGPAGLPDRPRQQQQRPRVDATINDPVTKVVGLILGTPEFQRQ